MCDFEENSGENDFHNNCELGVSMEQNCDEESEMADREEVRQYPRTPGKRQRRMSDVIDSMGESPASTSSYGYSRDPSTPTSSIGFVTPQRPIHSYWPNMMSPDQGYSSPEMTRQQQPGTPEHMYSQPVSSQGSLERDTSIIRLPSTMSFTLSQKSPDQTDDSFPVSTSGRMAVHKDAERYNMKHSNRGKCVVFNHEHFDNGFAPRDGTRFDAERIERTFQKLGFTVEIYDDYEHKAILSKLDELSKDDHTDSDCLCVFVLTHGMANDLICAKDAAYRSEMVWKPFTADRCASLAGKPKLFFFQACRGDSLDGGVSLFRGDLARTEPDSLCESYKIPTHADFLLAHSTPQGFYSWRHTRMGTWYVQSLCDVLDANATTTDLAKMLTITARKVALDFASFHHIDPALNDQKQVPSVTSMLIRDLYFFTPENQ